MKLGVSNLAFGAAAAPGMMARLAELGVGGIEVAPTRIAGWEDLGAAELAAYRRAAAGAGLVITSLQAIFFGRPEDQLLGDEAGFRLMADHVRKVGGIAAALGARIAVFGAPRNRNRGGLDEAAAFDLAVARLTVLGEIAQADGLTLGMEPVPARYGADFLCHAGQVRPLVAACGHAGVRTHLDTGCVTLAGDEIGAEILATGAGLAHFHIAEPDLAGFEAPTCPHAAAAAALREIGYDGWHVIEMREPADGVAALETAVRFARGVYG